METFNWCPVPGMSVPTEPKVNKIPFGDGFEQRQKKGINNNLRPYTVTFRVKRDDAWLLDDFLLRHGAVDAFLWTPPFRHKQIKVVCDKWTPNVLNTIVEFTCEFREVTA